MKTSAFVLLACTASAMAGEMVMLEFDTFDGRDVKVARLVQEFPKAIQIVDENGKIVMLRKADIPVPDLKRLRMLEPTRELATPTPESALRADVKIVNVGSVSSTYNEGGAGWSGSPAENRVATITEVHITLRTPGRVTAQVFTVIGSRVALEDVELVESRAVSVRMTTQNPTRRMLDPRSLGIVDANREATKAGYFVQVQVRGKVIGEAGTLPQHKANTPLRVP